jgi:molybdenum cofactor cytidylyltransferase
MHRQIKFGVAILAAGASTRMGGPKMILPWAGTTVIGHIVHLWADKLHAIQVAVVCAPAPSAVPTELDRLGFPTRNRITNHAPEAGMFSSIQTAAAWQGWNAGLNHFVLALGDQPHLWIETLTKLLEAVEGRPREIHQPSLNGRPRHPIIFPAAEFRALAETEHRTLRDFLAGSKRTLIELDDAGLDLDLDYPADYQAARALAAQTGIG